MKSHLDQWRLATVAAVSSVLALAACASPPPPTAAMERARAAIEGAQQDGAEQLAAAELQGAQSKLAQAQHAVSQKDMEQAKYFAEESEMEAIHADQAALAQHAENAKNELGQTQSSLGSGSTVPVHGLPTGRTQ